MVPAPFAAKVARPLVRGAVPRPRLFERLDQLRERPVIWVCGPAGCGKTTLVGSYLEARRLPLLWYQVDAGDKDPATFFYYMGLASKRASPRYRKPLPLLTPEYLPGLPTFTLRYFEALYSRLKTPSVVVLDNLHELDGDPGLHEVIRGGLSRLPPGLNAFLISRNGPPSAFARMVANQEMAVLGWEELRLTPEESAEIIRGRSTEPLSRKDLLHLHQAADGWAAGLVIIIEWVKREKIDPRALQKTPPEQIFDYFGNEIFGKIDPATQEFLLKTALLPRMTAKMAEELTGQPAAAAILSRLSSQNNFTERRFHIEPMYQYHPLFREFLLSRGRGFFPMEELSRLRHRAAALLEEARETEAAAALLCEAADWEGLIALIMKHAPALLAHGRNRALESWLSHLPNEVTESTPWLFYWRGACKMPSDPTSARTWFERAFKAFKERVDAAGIFLSWAGAVDAISWEREDLAPLDGWIQELDGLIGRFGQFPAPEIEARVASAMVIALVLRQPWHPDLDAWASRALSKQTPHALMANFQTMWFVMHRDLNMGEFDKYARAREHMLQMVQSWECPPFVHIMVSISETRYLAETGQNEECVKVAFEGLEIARCEGIHLLDPMLLGALVVSALDANDWRRARGWLEEMRSSLNILNPYDASFYYFLKGREALIRGDLKEALHHTDLALKLLVAVGGAFLPGLALVVKARVLHAMGLKEEAGTCLTQAYQHARKTSSRLGEFHALMAEAEFSVERGREADGLTTLRKALRLGREGGYLNVFVDVPSATARLCARALEAGVEVEYVQELIRKRHLVLEDPPYHLENWPWPLRI